MTALTAEQRTEIAKRAAETRRHTMTDEQRSAAGRKAAATRRANLAPEITIKAKAIIDCIHAKAKDSDKPTISNGRIVVIKMKPDPIAVNARSLIDLLKVLGDKVTLKRTRDGLIVSQDRIISRFNPLAPDDKTIWVDLWK